MKGIKNLQLIIISENEVIEKTRASNPKSSGINNLARIILRVSRINNALTEPKVFHLIELIIFVATKYSLCIFYIKQLEYFLILIQAKFP